ncbi:MAG: glycosyltransferase involved in cell wall biosynthesis [Phenylobacterium sp.]|jgi:glycosyltransferase involved in cell wall biosynthesis
MRSRFKAAVFVSNPKGIYSGGRYHGLMLTEALAELGIETYYVTNLLPTFWQDMVAFPAHNNIKTVIGFDQAKQKLPANIDFSFIVPGTNDTTFYDTAIECSMSCNAKISLINFESHNWFNAYAEEKKPLAFWNDWQKVASASSLILSSSAESSKYAKIFYNTTSPSTIFEHCYPSINSLMADTIDEQDRENKILLFARFKGAEHKGGERVVQILNEHYSGWKLTIVVGTGDVPETVKASFENRAAKFNIELEWLFKISDEDKFKLYKSSKILLFPSYFEGFGYPPIEARYCGCKVVAFELPVLKETCGSDIVFAKHGDWSDFSNKMSEVLQSSDFSVSGERLKDVALFSAMAAKLQQVIDKLDATPNSYESYISHYKEKAQSNWRSKITNLVEDTLVYFAKKLRKKLTANGNQITYFPKFQNEESLNNHYYRAAWYFPYKENLIDKVNLYLTNGAKLGECPAHMSNPNKKTDHVKLKTGKMPYLIDLLSSDVVLLWDSQCQSWWLKLLGLVGVTVINVDTDDLNSKEYGTYPGIIWRHLLTNNQRKEVITNSYQTFCNVAEDIKLSGKNKAVVFGTAPSLESATDYDYDGCIGIVCNSTVQNQALLSHIKPTFVTAGDAVSHFGVSVYADVFRQDLCKALVENDLYYFGTATFGYFLMIHYPELAHKFILIEQKTDGPNFNLLENFSAPKLDSTMNIHMLPLAATFARDIYILGCDGKDPDEKKNEDFWGHASSAQYHSLVDSGHQCHPTFDTHRQISTYSGYVNSVLKTLNTGSFVYGIRYTSLKTSYVPGFSDRHLTPQWYQHNDIQFPTSIEKLGGLLEEIDSEETQFFCDSSLVAKLAISKCSVQNSELLIKGWFLTPHRKVDLMVDIDGKTSIIFNRIKRPDLASKFPEYNQVNVGFEFTRRLKYCIESSEINVKLMNEGELLISKSSIVEKVEV